MSTMANPPPGAYVLEDHNEANPFVTNSHDAHRQRYSAFDNSQFSLYLNGSPEQAKRALQAHLSETARRLQEASVLGNSLVRQKQELEEKLQEVEKQQANDEIGPELRQRLAELEREFNEVGRETARAFVPKSRVPSGETDATGGASIYSSEAQHSPSKVSVPSRKQRNQQPSRINDIALATEISTSLLSQLKELQSVLLEKEDALKHAHLEISQSEIEVEGLSQRLRTLDESENRLKDVNWNLETQVRELEAAAKAQADKEQRMNHSLNLARTEKSTLERDLEEMKQLYAKQHEELISKTRAHETELSGLRRNVTMAETERGALQRKVDELASQNQELARAVAYRMRAEDHAPQDNHSADDRDEEGDTITPENSPPPSPSKATPRHGQLESETLKHSLHHAHRMIQQLKNNIHREKTEKLELKRMLQDARDELEVNRNPVNGPGSASKRKKNDKDVFKKPARPDRLGALRNGSQEIVVDDDEWEEDEALQTSPSKPSRNVPIVPGAFPSGFSSAAETGNETSDAFETANEHEGTTTETDAFQTGAETLDGDSTDDLTETEAGPSTVRASRPSPLPGIGRSNSYQSTASTSGDDDDYMDAKTPIQSQHPRYKLKMRQYRRSAPGTSGDIFADAPPAANDSPASVSNSNSNHSTPAQGKSLFAELGAFSGDDEDESVGEGTPSRSLLSPESSPEALRNSTFASRSPLQSMSLPKPTMVDSEMMTEPWTAEIPKNLGLSSVSSNDTVPVVAPQPALDISSLSAQDTLPVVPSQPALLVSSLSMQETEPKTVPPPSMDRSSFSVQETEPKPAQLPLVGMSGFSSQDTVPRLSPPPSLHMSTVSAHSTEPVSPVMVAPPSINFSSMSHQTTEPREIHSPVSSLPAPVVMSSVYSQSTEPVEPSHLASARQAPLLAGSVSDHTTESREIIERAPFEISSLSSQETSPEERVVVKPQFSSFMSQITEPIEPSKPALSQQSLVSSQATEPVHAVKPVPSFSQLSSQATEPVHEVKPAPTFSQLSYQATSPVETAKPALQFSMPLSQATAPVAPPQSKPEISAITVQHTSPVEQPIISRSGNRFSNVLVLNETQPESPTLPTFLPNPSRPSTANRVPKSRLSLSTIFSQNTEPLAPSRPATAHRAAPVALSTSAQKRDGGNKQEGTKPGFLGSILPWSTAQPESTDAGMGDVRAPVEPDMPDTVQANSKAPRMTVVEQGTQTMVSSDQIDKLLQVRSAHRYSGSIAAANIERSMSPPSPTRRGSDPKTPRRPGSSSSIRSRTTSPPPLPSDHKEVIAAAALKAPPAVPGTASGDMGPPTMPASAYKKRPQTPTLKTTNLGVTPKTGGTTPRPRNHVSRGDPGRSGASSPMSRTTSMSSFTSEVDRRFNTGINPFAQNGFDMSTTDPRMIQAITQTMIGEFLWKYTRKAGREGLSEKRHRRFFWVHPYTRTLYWSEQDPQTAGRTQLKAKSVAIESVQVVTDDNCYPPGLHRKSIVVITPGRTVKFTAPTGQRHETWYNALTYLLQRSAEEPKGEQELETDEIQSEFNPGFRSTSRQTAGSRFSSYSRSHTSSPHHTQVPTLRKPSTPSQKRSASTEPGQESMSGRLSSLSVFRPGSTFRNSFSSRRGRSSAQASQASAEYHQPEQDSNYNLSHELAARSVPDSPQFEGMENVRACCDGKHDVGHLHFHSQKGRHNSNTKSTRSSLAGSMSSRTHSRTEAHHP